MPAFIRPATTADEPALSRICLLTADAGVTWAFLLVDKHPEEREHEEVVGYCIGSLDTRVFEAAASERWWPPLRVQYGPLLESNRLAERPLKQADRTYIDTILNCAPASDAQIRFSPAHLHINVLPSHQSKGHGRQLIGRAMQYLKEKNIAGVWLQMDPRNVKAAGFYSRLGFGPVEGTSPSVVGITVKQWEEKWGELRNEPSH
ncbi:acyl-CoA N-acyltransferase [Pisolithus marmoratus]|nr:acyl-CoA N-acyltransferase [Pisolithus marmoratus]